MFSEDDKAHMQKCLATIIGKEQLTKEAQFDELEHVAAQIDEDAESEELVFLDF